MARLLLLNDGQALLLHLADDFRPKQPSLSLPRLSVGLFRLAAATFSCLFAHPARLEVPAQHYVGALKSAARMAFSSPKNPQF